MAANKGIDISAPRGTPIYAAGAGKVVYVGNQLRGYGNLIMIKHSEDYITAYAHNDTMLVNNGQSVKAGQKIATMGSTDAASVRLHFQIRYRATAIESATFTCRLRAASQNADGELISSQQRGTC
ncbi:lipoprotein ygeR [Escherichia coli]|uniref:Lipoprotein ygeR n=1 Tax=Escherichia coli TaxID=562 RepID=A0A2X1N786_ECOLX|nr:lipoprotein ygeR [Escherichia coli]